MARPPDKEPHRHGRREILKASLAGAAVFAGSSAGAAGSVPASAAEVTATEAQTIAAVLYGANLPAEDAEAIASGAASALANLKYLTLLTSDDVQLAFGYPALIDEAARSPATP